MIHSPLSDFLIAARIDADYREKALTWEEYRRLDDRLDQLKLATDQPYESMNMLLNVMLVTGVSSAQQQRLEERLGNHQIALVEVLQENREQLDLAEERVGDLLGKAHVLPDGRRVFETEDGRQVYDEHGSLLSGEDITPDDIEDHRPKWETYHAAKMHRDELVEQQNECKRCFDPTFLMFG